MISACICLISKIGQTPLSGLDINCEKGLFEIELHYQKDFFCIFYL